MDVDAAQMLFCCVYASNNRVKLVLNRYGE